MSDAKVDLPAGLLFLRKCSSIAWSHCQHASLCERIESSESVNTFVMKKN